MTKRKVIFDIDGTLADNDHRVHHLHQTPKNWKTFFDLQPLDTPRFHVLEILDMYAEKNTARIALLTGRGEEHREVTVNWLKEYSIPYDTLVMRPAGDRTDDHILKMAQIKAWQEEGWEIIGFFEDRKRICDAAREHGITVFQVAEGDF